MKASEFRAKARERLAGKWGKAACIVLAYFVISILFSFVTGLFEEGSVLASLVSIAITIIELPLSFGLIIAFYNLYSSKEVGAFDFLSLGFQNFKRAWAIAFRMFLKLLAPFILLIVSVLLLGGAVGFAAASAILGSSASGALVVMLIGFILYVVSLVWMITRSYYYVMSYYVAIDNPELSAKEAVNQSREMMTNNRAKLFWLELSFIGWMFLAILTLGIGIFWLAPYMTFAEIAFYHFVAKKDENTVVEETPENPTETLE